MIAAIQYYPTINIIQLNITQLIYNINWIIYDPV